MLIGCHMNGCHNTAEVGRKGQGLPTGWTAFQCQGHCGKILGPMGCPEHPVAPWQWEVYFYWGEDCRHCGSRSVEPVGLGNEEKRPPGSYEFGAGIFHPMKEALLKWGATA